MPLDILIANQDDTDILLPLLQSCASADIGIEIHSRVNFPLALKLLKMMPHYYFGFGFRSVLVGLCVLVLFVNVVNGRTGKPLYN